MSSITPSDKRIIWVSPCLSPNRRILRLQLQNFILYPSIRLRTCRRYASIGTGSRPCRSNQCPRADTPLPAACCVRPDCTVPRCLKYGSQGNYSIFSEPNPISLKFTAWAMALWSEFSSKQFVRRNDEIEISVSRHRSRQLSVIDERSAD